MTSLSGLQMLILLLFFAAPSLLQKLFGPSLEKQWFVSGLVLACNGSELDESPSGTKEREEIFGAKKLNKEKGSNQAHCDIDLSLSLSCISLAGTLNLPHAQLLQLLLTSYRL